MNRRNGGFLMFDALAALAIVAGLSGVLAVALNAQNRGMHHLSDMRLAMRIAENTITNLQAGRAMEKPQEGVTCIVKPLADTKPIGNWHWVQVDVNVRGRAAHLIGVVPQNATEQP